MYDVRFMKLETFLEQPIPLLLEGVPEGRGSYRDKSLVDPHKRRRSAVWG